MSTCPQSVSYNAIAFQVHGQPVWLHAGDIHYFRHPHALWRETLLRAQRAGLNTISTYIPWNLHEQQEGVYGFDGDLDIGAYLDLIAELGMYAMVRPGPYICSEWDGGGQPAWLATKPDIRLRDDDPVYLACVARWFAQLLPHIARRQIGCGGSVILVQNENEYHGGWNASTRRYIQAINDIFHQQGITVPIIACNGHAASATELMVNYSTDPADQILDPHMIITYNCGGEVGPLTQLRALQPDKPLLITELWTGAQVFWGYPVPEWPEPISQTRALYEMVARGTQLTYYMFDGGTNFGSWAGRDIATSYESRYPVREGGLLDARYYQLKPLNHFITQFGTFLATSSIVPTAVTVPTGTNCLQRAGDAGQMLFVLNDVPRPAIELGLPDGIDLPVALPAVGAAILPYQFAIFPDLCLDYANLSLLGKHDVRRVIVLQGQAGTEGVISINGQVITVPVCRNAVTRIPVDAATLLVVDEGIAQRTWFVDEHLIFGPDFVGERDIHGRYAIHTSAATPDVLWVDAHGALVSQPPTMPQALPSLPAIAPWQMAPCPEVAGLGEGWQDIAGPCSHEALGQLLGYVWYRAEVESPEDTVAPLFVSAAINRLLVYVNGQYCGTPFTLDGRGSPYQGHADRHAEDLMSHHVHLPLRTGRNVITMLSDNLGRNFVGNVIDRLGLCGPVAVGAQRIPLGRVRELPPTPLTPAAFAAVYAKEFRTAIPLPGIVWQQEIPAGTQAYLVMPPFIKNAALSVNGEFLCGAPYTLPPKMTWAIPAAYAGQTVEIQLQYQPDASGASYPLPHLYLVPDAGVLQKWAWKPLAADPEFSTPIVPAYTSQPIDDQPLLLIPDAASQSQVGRSGLPAYFRTTFTVPPGEAPVFVRLGNLAKGHLYLNGRHLGRYWQIAGTQDRYYLPRPWLQAENELVVFDEFGTVPSGISLQWGTANCHHTEWLDLG